jgi:hypothetical protein
MVKGLKIDMVNSKLVMNKGFAKAAAVFGSYEYDCLQQARRDYPEFKVITKQIKKNPNKKSYKGLNYDYMRSYIMTHESQENKRRVLDELEEMIIISNCHSDAFRYPTIKRWFLNKYPQIEMFGIGAVENAAAAAFSIKTKEEETESAA